MPRVSTAILVRDSDVWFPCGIWADSATYAELSTNAFAALTSGDLSIGRIGIQW